MAGESGGELANVFEQDNIPAADNETEGTNSEESEMFYWEH